MAKLMFDDTPHCFNCDYLSKQKDAPTITWPPELWDQWVKASKFKPELELLALFDVADDGTVTSLTFPKQEVEQAACELLEQNGHAHGMIHSHHNMGASFSSMDRSTVLPNYRFSIVTNHKGDYEAVERVELPCGGYGFRKLTVAVEESAADAALRAHVLEQASVPKPKVVVPMQPTTPEPFRSPGLWDGEYALDHHSWDDDAVVTGCDHCQAYWPTMQPQSCWFCRRPTDEFMSWAISDWTDCEEEMDKAPAGFVAG